VPDIDAPTHAYVGASAGCWAIFGELSARRQYAARYDASLIQLSVDSYMVQHPGVAERRSIQSVCVHLISLCYQLEKGADGQAAIQILKRAAARSERFVWLEPPSFAGTLTVVDVAAASDLAQEEALTRRWAQSVWTAWRDHHALIRQWAASL
jgi:hypothetical protein